MIFEHKGEMEKELEGFLTGSFSHQAGEQLRRFFDQHTQEGRKPLLYGLVGLPIQNERWRVQPLSIGVEVHGEEELKRNGVLAGHFYWPGRNQNRGREFGIVVGGFETQSDSQTIELIMTPRPSRFPTLVHFTGEETGGGYKGSVAERAPDELREGYFALSFNVGMAS